MFYQVPINLNKLYRDLMFNKVDLYGLGAYLGVY